MRRAGEGDFVARLTYDWSFWDGSTQIPWAPVMDGRGVWDITIQTYLARRQYRE